MPRTVKKTNSRFEFSTPQPPRLEVFTIEEMSQGVDECDKEIAHITARKDKWIAMLTEAEALDGSV